MAAWDAAATVAVSGSTPRVAARHRGRPPRPRFRLPRAGFPGVPEPPRRALRPWQLRLPGPLLTRPLHRRCRPLGLTVVRRDFSHPSGHHDRRRWASPDRARRSSLSLRPGLNAVTGWPPLCPLHAEILARRGCGGVVFGMARLLPPVGPGDVLQPGEFSFQVWQSNRVRSIVALVAALLGAGAVAAPPATAGPTVCDYPTCTPGIMPHQVLGAPCDNTTYYAFGVADGYVSFASEPGRLMFCGSPRRYQPRWFRSPPMAGVKDENADCQNYLNYVAQAPDGLFLICIAHDGISSWVRADT